MNRETEYSARELQHSCNRAGSFGTLAATRGASAPPPMLTEPYSYNIFVMMQLILWERMYYYEHKERPI